MEQQELLKRINKRITFLESQLEEQEKTLNETIEGATYSILNFGLSKYAEKLTVTYGKLEELYSIRELLENE